MNLGTIIYTWLRGNYVGKDYDGNKYYSDRGLHDLLVENIEGNLLYDIIHLKGEDIEIALTHITNKYNEEY